MPLKLIFYIAIATFLQRNVAIAQLPVEVFAGNKKATVDIMFFRFFKTRDKKDSKFLFFNRNRASVDYKETKTTDLPQFGFTEAISYNDKRFRGFAPVAVVSILNKGVFPKMGIQFVKITKDFTIFSWLVTETLKDPNLDFFFLGRYTPKLAEKLNLYTQLETVNAFPTAAANNYTFTQRFRLGLKIKAFQFGAGLDLSESGRNKFTHSQNAGGFLRYEF